MSHEDYRSRFDNKNPITNPIMYQHNRNYKNEPVLGKAGKIYLKRGRMHNPTFSYIVKPESSYYAVPLVWEQPEGFGYDKVYCWKTESEIIALRHYREYGVAQHKLKKKFDAIIEKQDELYKLSKSIKSETPLPKVKEGFIPREHQVVVMDYGKKTDGCFILADQQRTGKSFGALLYILSEKWDKVLIVCPAKVSTIWEKMINTICDHQVNILKSNGILNDNTISICSYDTLHTIEDLSCDIAVGDEIHFVLEKGNRRNSAIHRVVANKKLALSGTPTMNKVEDILSILDWVRPELSKEISVLIKSHSELNSYDLAKLVSQELKRRCLLLRETSQVGTTVTPYLNYIDIPAKLSDPNNLQEIGRAKVMFATEYINSFDNKIVAMFHYKETGRQLLARLGTQAIMINGESSKAEIKDALDKFERGDIRVLIGSTILGEGVDLSHADQILMLEESHYSLRCDQMRERCNNIFKNTETIIDVLRIKNSREDRVYELINNKYSINQGLRDA